MVTLLLYIVVVVIISSCVRPRLMRYELTIPNEVKSNRQRCDDILGEQEYCF